MPEYCYTCDCGKSRGVRASMGEAPESPECKCGEKMYRDYALEHGRMVVSEYSQRGKVWYDIATHPEDVASEREIFRAKGIGADIQPDGGIVTYSDRQRQQVLRLIDG